MSVSLNLLTNLGNIHYFIKQRTFSVVINSFILKVLIKTYYLVMQQVGNMLYSDGQLEIFNKNVTKTNSELEN